MQQEAFRLWLSNTPRNTSGAFFDARTVDSRFSNCRTVERYEGDLDFQFDQDNLKSLVERLIYSREDERQNRPPLHKIPIDGNIYNGTATLRAAIRLYKDFRNSWAEGSPILQSNTNRTKSQTIVPISRLKNRSDWPEWNQPSPEEVLALAQLAVPFIRFMNPDIVRAVAEDNERQRIKWVEILKASQVDPIAYLWPGSPCAFPGVRRYAGSQEIAVHHGHTQLGKNQTLNAVALDDNDYPKQIWSFIFRGKQFSKFGPKGYSLAHLADHKEHGNRFDLEFEVIGDKDVVRSLYGLYTCPSNTVYISSSLIKPTDFVGTIRALLVRRAEQLYGSFCKILPPFLRIPAASSPKWEVNEFNWGDPVGTTEHVQDFLEFRQKRMSKLIEAYRNR